MCTDTGPAEQLGRALSQHETLISELKNTGFTDVQVIPILVGTSGTIYHQHTLDSLQALGLSRAETRKAASKLHTQAIRSMHNIVQITKVLEQVHVLS